jgi:hypothetical protein
VGDPVAQAVYTVAGGDDPSAGPESRGSSGRIGPVATGAEALTSPAVFLDVLHALYVNAAEVDGVHGV